MILIDTSVWIAVYRDRSGAAGRAVSATAGSDRIAVTGFVRLELLQGTRDDAEWLKIGHALSQLTDLPPKPDIWDNAARIYFDLRRIGITIASTLDLCIAQTAIDYGAELLHADGDLDEITKVRPLKVRRFVIGTHP